MKPNGTRQLRQGDVLLIPTDAMPTRRTKVAPVNGRLILAEGERTGHHHAIVMDRPTDAALFAVADEVDLWLRVQQPVPLTHEEHGTITIGDNVIVRRQVEYAPAAIRQVAD